MPIDPLLGFRRHVNIHARSSRTGPGNFCASTLRGSFDDQFPDNDFASISKSVLDRLFEHFFAWILEMVGDLRPNSDRAALSTIDGRPRENPQAAGCVEINAR